MTTHADPVFWDALPLMLTAAEAAPIVRLTPNALYVMARQHRITHVHYGRDVRFDRDDLRRGASPSHTHATIAASEADALHSSLITPIAPRRRQSTRAAGR